jgi:hypothetical protein
LKFALVPYFAMMAVAGSTPDIGFEAAAVMGLLASLTSAKKKSIYCRRNRKRPPPKGNKPSRPFMI